MIQETYPERSFVVFFDCDGTLTGGEGSWPAVHNVLGTNAFREQELNRYLDGKQTYEEWTRRTAEEWEGRGADAIREAFESIELTDGLRDTVESLHEMGAVTGIVSAGVGQFVDLVGVTGGFDFVVANTLGVERGQFDGTADVRVTDQSKTEVYGDIVENVNLNIKHVVMIGDSVHDVHKIHPDNLSIAYDPNDDQAVEEADIAISDNDLRLVLQPIEDWLNEPLANQD